VHSLRPNTLRAIMQLVNAVMYDPGSGLSRAQREMVATVVSATNRCTY
jgi:alkylhydroperoxidase family enzyme